MGKSSDQLREEIGAQRSDAGEKIDHLQQQLQTQVDDTRQQVTDTATHVREEAQAVVTDTVDSVKQAVEGFDFTRRVEEHPLVSVGAALFGGVLLGAVLDSGNSRGTDSANHNSGSNTNQGGHEMGGTSGFSNTIRSAAQKTGLEDTISNAGAALVGSVTEQLKEMLNRSFPNFSEKLDSAQQQPGAFTDKAKAAQKDAQQQ